ncbi:MAG: UDP-N-acetylglucosamine 1-carboxyvinyltransferase [Parcubacteria group bacterium CG1_02_41_12]|nr:MAG: UDP-N-acetylglucosamine 1-carboxyvinyltransferase [Parcubacteria group bacterium CG1_02_41_12]
MSKFIIKGGKQLNGTWQVQGMKNAATPVLAATLLTREQCFIHNIPRISDISHMLEILEDLGSKVAWVDEHTVQIHTPEIKKHEMDYLLTKRMRSSVLCMGPLLASIGNVLMPEPGGCNIGNRPLDAHFKAFEALGAKVKFEQDKYYTINGKNLQAGKIKLIEKSVTATENAMMASSRLSGTTVITNCAQEPHIMCLADFLRAIGVKVDGAGTNEIRITGSKDLKGCEFEIIPDQLEVGTIAVLGALCGGEIEISPVVSEHMEVIKQKLDHAGVRVDEKAGTWIVRGSKNSLSAFEIKTEPYPGFPTDLQAPFGVLATQVKGNSVICDPMYENRLAYMNELNKMGAKTVIKDEHTAEVEGPTDLKGADIHSLDLRAGATLIIAALAAIGESVINEAEIIDRGYEKIDERLKALGADIERVE